MNDAGTTPPPNTLTPVRRPTTPAQRVYDALEQAPGEWTIEELARFTHLSKTGVRRALKELDEEGSIALYTEEGHHDA